MNAMITTVIVHYVIRRSHNGYANITLEQSFHVLFILFISLQIWHWIYILHHVAICKMKIKVYKSEFLEKHKGDADLNIGCNKFFALRSCF
jgi:hypothetical protein